MVARFEPKPEWLKVRAPGGERYHRLKETFRALDLHTVCEEARCPNVGECWREGTATVMLLGETCTRGCRFCAVTTGDPKGFVDTREPEHTARAIARLELQYVVMTMVDRDDLLDGGADHVARTVRRLRELRPDVLIETLVGDFQGHPDAIATVLSGGPDVFAHNIEVVERLQRTVRDVRCGYARSLDVLRQAKAAPLGHSTDPRSRSVEAPTAMGRRLTKSSIMVGIGETDDEVVQCLKDLREAGVDVVTIGQYLRPSAKHLAVDRFVEPETFASFERTALEMGFLYAASGPLVRSSYRAAEVFLRSLLGKGDASMVAYGTVDEALSRRLEAARKAAANIEAEAGGLVPVTSLVRR